MKEERFYLSRKDMSVAEAFLNKGLLWGEAPFTTMLCKRGKLIFKDEHLLRLNRTIDEIYGVELVTPTVNKIREALDSIALEYQKIEYSYFRVTLFQELSGQLEFFIWSFQRSPIRAGLALSCQSIVPSEDYSCVVKKSDYSSRFRKRDQLRTIGFDDSLYIDQRGRVLDTSTASSFFIKNGVVHINELIPGVLDGICRSVFLKYLALENIPHRIASISRDELSDFDEVWCGDAFNGLRPVLKLDEKEFQSDFFVQVEEGFNAYCGGVW